MRLRLATGVATAAALALGVPSGQDKERQRVIRLTDEIRRRFPNLPLAYGIDAKGPWARLGDHSARAKPGCEAALNAVLELASSKEGA